MVTRRDFLGNGFKIMQQQCLSSLNRLMSFRWLYPALLLLSLALLRQTLTFSSSSLLPRSQSDRSKPNSCANFSDPLILERYMLRMSDHQQTDAAWDHHPVLPDGDRYMWYAPHDGFDKQVSQLVNALKIAMLLNRTLIVPPILEEQEIVVGDCLESQLTSRKLRQLSWSAVAERIADSRYSYVSIADIIDLRTVSPKWVRTIDMRVFLALWCGVDVSSACSAEGEICRDLTNSVYQWKELESCSSRFLPTERSCLVLEVEESCKTTIWTNSENRATRNLWEQILEKKLLERYGLSQEQGSSTNQQYDDHYYIKRKSVVESLGPGTAADHHPLLLFGSLSSQSFGKLRLLADIRPTPGNDMMAQAFAEIEALPYTEEIMRSTRSILELSELTSRPFLCTHLGLGNARNGQEENADEEEAERILTAFRSRLEKLVEEQRSKSGGDKVNLFVMTDLSSEIWKQKYLRDIADNSTYYEIHTVDGYEDMLLDTAQKTVMHEYGLRSGYIPPLATASASSGARDDMQQQQQQYWDSGSRKVELPPDIRGCIEQLLCSCASLGFYGTSPSAVSSRIIGLRGARRCPTLTTPAAVS